uniref:PH01B001I13.15 protein n=1 Tax=Phyllostachys edulis TaxID=38705 RepID=L0P1L7_PHYED|nr:PH01B001I13.15 [Phyllostachys edulis]
MARETARTNRMGRRGWEGAEGGDVTAAGGDGCGGRTKTPMARVRGEEEEESTGTRKVVYKGAHRVVHGGGGAPERADGVKSDYAKKIVDKAALTDCNPYKYPIEPKIRLEMEGELQMLTTDEPKLVFRKLKILKEKELVEWARIRGVYVGANPAKVMFSESVSSSDSELESESVRVVSVSEVSRKSMFAASELYL